MLSRKCCITGASKVDTVKIIRGIVHWKLFVHSVETSMAARKHFGDSIEVKFCSKGELTEEEAKRSKHRTYIGSSGLMWFNFTSLQMHRGKLIYII